MEAHNVKYGTKVIVTDENVKTPPSSIPIKKGDEITIHRLDGMYCNGTDKDGNRILLLGGRKLSLAPNNGILYGVVEQSGMHYTKCCTFVADY